MSIVRRLIVGALLAGLCARHVTAQHASTVVIVVRHADKDTIPKDDPPLTAAGVARAKALAAALANADVQAVITTQLIRSRETARPLAEARRLTTIVVPRGADIAQHARTVAAAVRRQHGKTVLVVGHGETVGPIIEALGGPAIPEVCADEYSNLYTLVLYDAGSAVRLIHSSYGAPSGPHMSPCASGMKKP
jgi:broad specificity phosphatase PhoE